MLEGAAREELVRDFKQVTANLQLAYADAAKGEADPTAKGHEDAGAPVGAM